MSTKVPRRLQVIMKDAILIRSRKGSLTHSVFKLREPETKVDLFGERSIEKKMYHFEGANNRKR